MNKQSGMHDGIYELLRRIGDFVREGHALPRYTARILIDGAYNDIKYLGQQFTK